MLNVGLMSALQIRNRLLDLPDVDAEAVPSLKQLNNHLYLQKSKNKPLSSTTPRENGPFMELKFRKVRISENMFSIKMVSDSDDDDDEDSYTSCDEIEPNKPGTDTPTEETKK